MIKVKQVMVCMLSALLVSSIGVTAFAVGDSDTGQKLIDPDISVVGNVVGPDINELGELGAVGSTPSGNDVSGGELTDGVTSKDESLVSEETSDVSETSVEQSSQVETSLSESSIQESSKPESSGDIDKELSSHTLSIYVDFANSRISNTTEDRRVDFSNVQMSLLSQDKKQTIKKFDISEILQQDEVTEGASLKIDDIKENVVGKTYILHFDNLPEIYRSSSYDIEVNCEVLTNFKTGEKSIVGVDSVLSVSLSANLKDFNTMVFAYDKNYGTAPGVEVVAKLVNADNQVIYTKTVKTCKGGYALFKLPFESITDDISDVSVYLSVPTIFNNSLVTGEMSFPLVYCDNENPVVYELVADADISEEYDGLGADEIDTVSDIPINVEFKSANDMMLFEPSSLYTYIYSGTEVTQSFVFQEGVTTSSSTFLTTGYKYTVKTDGDYDTVINPVTLTATDGASVSIVATPGVTLTVINETEGVQSNAHFKVEGYDKEFSEKSHIFSTNRKAVITVKDLDTNEIYEVLIGDYKSTVLNLATGDVIQTGYVGSNSSISGTSSNSDSNTDVVTSVPKTGDIIFGVILTLVGLTGVSYLGYLYFKRKGLKTYEKQNK